MHYLVRVEHHCVEEGQSPVEHHYYTHNVMNSDEAAWEEVKKRYAKEGTTVYMAKVMAKVIKKAKPATHEDVEV